MSRAKYVLVFTLTVLLWFPLFWMFKGSFENVSGVLSVPPTLVPRTVTTANYHYLLRAAPILRWLGNTVFISVVSVSLSVSVSAVSAYAFSVFRFRGRRLLFWLYMASIMFPGHALFVPKFLVIRGLHLGGTRWAVILLYLFSPVHIYLFKCYLDKVPSTIRDCARIDGAGEARIIFQLMVPLCLPIAGALALFVFMGCLQDYIWQYLMLGDDAKKTLIVGIIGKVMREARNVSSPNPIGLSLAGGTILLAPLLAIFAMFQKTFRRGIMVGGVRE
jgi:ABC-type glycerol-3-phosphate transport system permease component